MSKTKIIATTFLATALASSVLAQEADNNQVLPASPESAPTESKAPDNKPPKTDAQNTIQQPSATPPTLPQEGNCAVKGFFKKVPSF